MGLIRHDDGEVVVLGRPMPAKQSEIKSDIGFVSEDMRLYAKATIGWHMQWFKSIYPDGRRIVTAGDDATARVWDALTGVLLNTLTGHTSRIESATFSPDWQRIVTASHDHTARVWDARSGALLHILEGHANCVNPASFSPNGRWIVTASDDATMRLWDAATGRELAQLLSFTDGSWAVIQPDTGRYDAGRGGRSTGECIGLHWVRDNRIVIELEELRDRYWEPGLLSKIMGHDPRPLREVPPLV